jgi:hypothetical protein
MHHQPKSGTHHASISADGTHLASCITAPPLPLRFGYGFDAKSLLSYPGYDMI